MKKLFKVFLEKDGGARIETAAPGTSSDRFLLGTFHSLADARGFAAEEGYDITGVVDVSPPEIIRAPEGMIYMSDEGGAWRLVTDEEGDMAAAASPYVTLSRMITDGDALADSCGCVRVIK